jgi:hypothetical protein
MNKMNKKMKILKKKKKIRRRRRWDSLDCAHVARRDLEWLVVVHSFKTQCAIRVRLPTTLQVIQRSMHVGHAQNAVGKTEI